MRKISLTTWAVALTTALGASEALAQSCESYSGGFAWSCSRAIPGLTCTQITEPADTHTWSDNYLCISSARRARFPLGVNIAVPMPGQ